MTVASGRTNGVGVGVGAGVAVGSGVGVGVERGRGVRVGTAVLPGAAVGATSALPAGVGEAPGTVPKGDVAGVGIVGEAFGAALNRGLTAHHEALVLRPAALRVLDRIDAIMIDPRALYTDELTVSRVLGVQNSERARAWEAVRAALDGNGLRPADRLPVARELGETSLMFLVHPTLAPTDMAAVADAVEKVMLEATH